jgi:hypothetical protein
MRAKLLVAMLAATALVALLLPGAAPAGVKPASRQLRPKVGAVLDLPGTNGFGIEVSLVDRRRLTLTAVGSGRVIEIASYEQRVRPRRDSDDIVAGLGRLGRIDVRFVPARVRRRKPPGGCRGGKTRVEQGHFVGLVAFRGERGFTRVRAHRAPGRITRTPPLTCAPVTPSLSEKQRRHDLEVVEHAEEQLEAESDEEGLLSIVLTAKARGNRVQLIAMKSATAGPPGLGFSASNLLVVGSRDRGRIHEHSVIGDLFDKGSLVRVSNRKHPRAETVLAPPAPFSGTATFRGSPTKAPSWTGDLRVDLPGFGPVRLAGPGTHASMCVGLTCVLRVRPPQDLPLSPPVPAS